MKIVGDRRIMTVEQYSQKSDKSIFMGDTKISTYSNLIYVEVELFVEICDD